MNDLDRWVDLEGPPPPGVRELLDVLVPPLSPEHEAELDRRLFAALATEQRRREERRRAVQWIAVAAAALAVVVAGAGGAVVVALYGVGTGAERSALSAQGAHVTASEAGDHRSKPVTAARDGGAPR